MQKIKEEKKHPLEYLSKKPFIHFDFSKHFEEYEKSYDLFDEDAKDRFVGDKSSWRSFFSSYSELLHLLEEFGFKSTLIENSLFIAKESNLEKPEYLLVTLNEHENMLRHYVQNVKKNVQGKLVGIKQFNSIIHHKELTTNPYYFKKYNSNVFKNRVINLRNLKHCIRRYHRNPIEQKGIGELLNSIETFFDEVIADYSVIHNSNELGNKTTNNHDLAILIPFPRLGESFLRHANLAGGCFFLFGSMDKNKSIEKLIVRVRQYIVDSLLHQTMLKSIKTPSEIKSEEELIHFFKSNINRNFIEKLMKAEDNTHGEGQKLVRQARKYSQKLLEKANFFLSAIHMDHEYLADSECKRILEDCIQDFKIKDVSIGLEYDYVGGTVYTHKNALKIMITMILDNAIKYMDRFWKSKISKGDKKIFIKVHRVPVGEQLACEVEIFNNGTEISEDEKANLGKVAPSGLSGDSTGWGMIIIYNALKKMDAYKFNEIDNYLKIDNVKVGAEKGVSIKFRLRINNN